MQTININLDTDHVALRNCLRILIRRYIQIGQFFKCKNQLVTAFQTTMTNYVMKTLL